MARRIAVIGSGASGAAVALFLHRNGEEVTLFEREPNPKPVGAGFMLQLTGQQVLHNLSLFDTVANYGHSIQKIEGKNMSGDYVLDLNFDHLPFNSYGIGMHRGLLFSIMHQEIKKEGITFRTGFEVKDILKKGNETYLESVTGETEGTFDLVVVANGSSSLLRNNLPITKRSNKQKWGAAWTVVPNTSNDFDNRIYQVYCGTKKMIGLMPIGRKEPADNASYLNVFWSLKMSDANQWREKGLENWKNEVKDLAPHLAYVINEIPDLDEVRIAPYYDVKLTPYYKDNVVFIGDAAHAMSPQLSCGVNNALLDAQVLAISLKENSSMETALKAFYQQRKSHNQFYQQLCRVITPLFQSSYPIGKARDFILNQVSSFSFTNQWMAENALGIRESLFKRLDEKYYLTK
ncbi:MAG: FAD-dependent oxidoreductase [Cyclobacteriaceae bacterium]